ncbi:polyhydroxyalkanoic acid system family protein [Xanthobacter sp. TB0139]|uniref:polyhydroxyalkanoic acid system family protein n=1 Tax=Xanthobacter sp. TB0139 TaxID=3459178 RepID=UPI004039C103
MASPFKVSLPHRLGQAEATRRIQTGLSTVRARFGSYITIAEEQWDASHLDFRIIALGKTATGTLDVTEDTIHLSMELPTLLNMLARKAEPMLRKEGQLMLEKK